MPALFRRRQIWVPTWQGALLLVVVVAAASLIALRHLASYLAAHDPATTRDGRGASTLIVEGWLDEDGLDAAIAVIGRGRYERVIASGGPIDGWREGRSWPTYAERGADYLRRHGVTSIPVVAVAKTTTSSSAPCHVGSQICRRRNKAGTGRTPCASIGASNASTLSRPRSKLDARSRFRGLSP